MRRKSSAAMVQCPVCDTLEVEKAVMAPRLAAKGKSAPSAEMKQLMAAMAQAQKKMLAQSDYVGERFVDEAARDPSRRSGRALDLGLGDQ